MHRRDYQTLIPAYLLLTAYVLLAMNHPFFWDTILLGSKHALWFYQNGLNSLLLPDNLDCGHFPFTGLYLALCWKIFGWSLPVSHLAFLPWVLGIAYQLWLLVKKTLPEKIQAFAFFLILADPTLLTQAGLVSPDVFLVFFFLLAVNSILDARKILLALALSGMVLSSLRGIMLAACLYLFNMFLHCRNLSLKENFTLAIRLLPSWIPAVLVAIAYLGYHFVQKGWIGFSEGSAWSGNYGTVSMAGAARNALIVGWRIADFGRIFLWLTGLFLAFRYLRPAVLFRMPFRPMVLLILSFTLVFFPVMIIYKGASNHRYLIPLFIAMTILLVQIIIYANISLTFKKTVCIALTCLLLSGNFWRYPEGIAVGWDSTLAHWPWYTIREEVHDYISKNKISPSSVGTDFPELASFESIVPGSGKESFSRIDTLKNEYVFWSNIMNNFPDRVKVHLDSNWIIKQNLNIFGVRGVLYQKTTTSFSK